LNLVVHERDIETGISVKDDCGMETGFRLICGEEEEKKMKKMERKSA
jgi:hypothetical protein